MRLLSVRFVVLVFSERSRIALEIRRPNVRRTRVIIPIRNARARRTRTYTIKFYLRVAATAVAHNLNTV